MNDSPFDFNSVPARTDYLQPEFDRMPALLVALPRWVCWGGGLGKGSKAPCMPSGKPAKVNDPITWSSFDACRAAYERGGFSGVGFVLDGLPIAGKFLLGIDVDEHDAATVEIPELKALLDSTYQERSPSGKGAHAFVFADGPLTKKLDARDGWPGVEIYTSGRYLTMTGQVVGDVTLDLAHEDGRLSPLLSALDRHPSNSGNAGASVAVRTAFNLPDNFKNMKALTSLDPNYRPGTSRFSDVHAPVNMEKLKSALLHVAHADGMQVEGDWKNAAMAVGRIAAREPERTEALYEILDSASRAAGGNYNEEENRSHFERFMREAAVQGGRDEHWLYRRAEGLGWQGALHLVQGAVAPPSTLPGPVSASTISGMVPPKRPWLHGNDALRGSVSLVVAPGGRGKSGLLTGMALACATGRPLMGSHVFAPPGGLRVLYISGEEGRDEIARRLYAAMTRHGLSSEDVGNLFVASVDQVKINLLRSERGDAQLDAAGCATLETQVALHLPDVVMMDPLANFSSATLNDNHAATALMSYLTRMAVRGNLAIIIAHHTAKGRETASQEAASGAAAIVNSARISLSVETMTDAEAAKMGIPPGDARQHFALGFAKANLAPAGARRWFRIEGVDIRNAQPPLYPKGDSVSVVVPWTPPAVPTGYPDAQLRAALECIQTASPPLASSRQSRGRFAPPIVAAAVAASGTPFSDFDAEHLLKHLLGLGWIAVDDVPVAKASGGKNQRKGYVLRPNRLWPPRPVPAVDEAPLCS
jgi:hypothetical protein